MWTELRSGSAPPAEGLGPGAEGLGVTWRESVALGRRAGTPAMGSRPRSNALRPANTLEGPRGQGVLRVVSLSTRVADAMLP